MHNQDQTHTPGHENHGTHVCDKCGSLLRNPHPSPNNKICGTIEGYNKEQTHSDDDSKTPGLLGSGGSNSEKCNAGIEGKLIADSPDSGLSQGVKQNLQQAADSSPLISTQDAVSNVSNLTSLLCFRDGPRDILAMFLGLYASVSGRLCSFMGPSFWHAAALTLVRGVSLLASHRRTVEFFRDIVGLDLLTTAVCALFVTSVFVAACSLPFEYVMIQIQNMQPDADGKYPYTGFLDCAVKILNAEGALKFYTGFPVYCAKISLRVVVTCFCLNELRKR